MPTCYPVFLNEVLEEYMKRTPKTVLDIGTGFGKWGFLFREYGDIFRGSYFKDDWKIKIDGIEIFKKYVDEHGHFKSIYNNVFIGDANSVIDTLDGTYEMIFAGDVIEHFEKDVALKLIEKIKAKATKSVMFVIPFGGDWEQGEVYGNDAETHRSTWSAADFPGAFAVVSKPDWRGRPIGFITYRF